MEAKNGCELTCDPWTDFYDGLRFHVVWEELGGVGEGAVALWDCFQISVISSFVTRNVVQDN